jgi:hypothetical protein
MKPEPSAQPPQAPPAAAPTGRRREGLHSARGDRLFAAWLVPGGVMRWVVDTPRIASRSRPRFRHQNLAEALYTVTSGPTAGA